MTQLKIYDEQMNPIGFEDKKVVHEKELWHKVFACLVFNLATQTAFYQTIFPKESYTFARPDYIDLSVGGHIDENENVLDGGVREMEEELGIITQPNDLIPAGITVVKADPSDTYHIREFCHLYLYPTALNLSDFNLQNSDPEVKSIIAVKIDDMLKLLQQHQSVSATERTFSKDRENEETHQIILSTNRIVPDYLHRPTWTDLLLYAKSLCVKDHIND